MWRRAHVTRALAAACAKRKRAGSAFLSSPFRQHAQQGARAYVWVVWWQARWLCALRQVVARKALIHHSARDRLPVKRYAATRTRGKGVQACRARSDIWYSVRVLLRQHRHR